MHETRVRWQALSQSRSRVMNRDTSIPKNKATKNFRASVWKKVERRKYEVRRKKEDRRKKRKRKRRKRKRMLWMERRMTKAEGERKKIEPTTRKQEHERTRPDRVRREADTRCYPPRGTQVAARANSKNKMHYDVRARRTYMYSVGTRTRTVQQYNACARPDSAGHQGEVPSLDRFCGFVCLFVVVRSLEVSTVVPVSPSSPPSCYPGAKVPASVT